MSNETDKADLEDVTIDDVVTYFLGWRNDIENGMPHEASEFDQTLYNRFGYFLELMGYSLSNSNNMELLLFYSFAIVDGAKEMEEIVNGDINRETFIPMIVTSVASRLARGDMPEPEGE